MNKKKNLILYIGLFILFVSIVGIGLYARNATEIDDKKVTDNKNEKVINKNKVKVDLKESEKTKKDIKVDDQLSTDNEVELIDLDVKEDVINKLNMILGLNDYKKDREKVSFDVNTNALSVGWTYLLNKKIDVLYDLFNGELDTSAKIKIALANSNFKSSNDEIKNEDVRNLINKYSNYYADFASNALDVQELSFDEFKITYNNLFNENISINDINFPSYKLCDDKNIIQCLMYGDKNQYNRSYGWYIYYHDASNFKFYRAPYLGGGSGLLFHVFYINKITQNSDYVNIYINYGIVTLDDNYDYVYICDNINYDAGICTDKKVIGKYDNRDNSLFDSKIDESNYKDFTNYRFVFKKNSSGNYYFVKVEKVK